MNLETNNDQFNFSRALRTGNLDDVRRLVDVVHINVNVDVDGWTPLVYAAINGRMKVVEFLVDYGANIETRYYCGRTVLWMASYWGEIEVVKFLVDRGVDVNVRDADGRTPAECAADAGKLEIVDFLTKVIEKRLIASVGSLTKSAARR